MQAAIVCSHWRAELPWLSAFEGAIRRAEREHRRRRVDDGYCLVAGIRITAAIRSHPDSSDNQRATRVVCESAEYDDTLQTAIVLCDRRVKRPVRTAFHCAIGRAECEHGRNRVLYRNRLAARVGIAAAIPCHPDSCDNLRAYTCIGEGAEYEDALQATRVLCHRHVELPWRTALHCPIGRTEREHRRSCVDDNNGLAAIGSIAGAICHQPVAGNKLRTGAIGFRVDDDESYVGAAAGVGRTRIIECPSRAALVGLIWRTDERGGTR